MGALKTWKKLLAKIYEMKDLREIKIIISWQIMRETATCTMNIYQSVFIRLFVTKERLIECNTNVIPIKAKSAIEMTNPSNN